MSTHIASAQAGRSVTVVVLIAAALIALPLVLSILAAIPHDGLAETPAPYPAPAPVAPEGQGADR